ncbi:hypothetical protein Bxe_B1560 [Paraburkholderia xenovorans LB400]|uniref:Uncharacterized protein n=1 Tax=Paraburkholderia xenovorans (strain LB400) TaxID=266265 RepID=Q13ND5_PARXL|nr:hypothetical protein Bxe_B1560 [Paraburkholderia xenovorans LB400]
MIYCIDASVGVVHECLPPCIARCLTGPLNARSSRQTPRTITVTHSTLAAQPQASAPSSEDTRAAAPFVPVRSPASIWCRRNT